MPDTDHPTPASARWRLLDRALALLALAILGVLALRAATTVDTGVDTWWYHLPWAARLAGLLPADAFVFSDTLEHYYEGFPKLAEWLQGMLWRLTGRVEATGFVALGSLVLFVAFLRWRFRVPAHLALLALVGIPLVHIHATAGHVDLTANLALTVAVLLVPPLLGFSPGQRDRRWRMADLALFITACGVAAHTKFQIIPVAALLYGVAAAAAMSGLFRAREPALRRHSGMGVALLLVAVPLVFYVPIKNLILFGNPAHPLHLKIGPISFTGPVTEHDRHEDRQAMLRRHRQARAWPSDTATGTPQQAAVATGAGGDPADGATVSMNDGIRIRPTDWVASVLERGMEPAMGRGSWNVLSSQGPPLPSRHGGYFGWYVLLNLAILLTLVARRPRERAGVLILFAGLSLVTAWLPNAVILRYYLYWMLVLVSLNLILLAGSRGDTARAVSQGWGSARLLGLAGLAAFLIAVYATRAEYFAPRFYFQEDLLETRRDPAVLAQVAAHPATCLAGERPPRYIIYSRLFNPGTSYRLKTGPEAGHRVDEIPAICGPGWTPVIAERADAGLLPAAPPGPAGAGP